MAGMTRSLDGARVLVVEDNTLIAMAVSGALAALGCTAVGPADDIARALELVEGEPLDAALLDVNLHGRSSEAVAAALAARGVPFAFATGYGDLALPMDGPPVLRKPFTGAELKSVLEGLFT